MLNILIMNNVQGGVIFVITNRYHTKGCSTKSESF